MALKVVSGYKSKDTERLRIEQKFHPLMEEELQLGNLVSYVGNKSVPFLRLYRYKEAFAFEFVRYFLKEFGLTSSDYVFDPFSGMGTTLFASMLQGISSIGVDRLPIAAFVAETLPKFLFIKKGELTTNFKRLQSSVTSYEPCSIAEDVPLLRFAFDDKTLLRLRQWKSAIETLPGRTRDVFLLLFFSILESTSFASNDGQFLRIKKDKRLAHPDVTLFNKVAEAEEDLERISWLFPPWRTAKDHLPIVFLGDTRALNDITFKRPPTAIITSPPYANRYDYTRSYCLELCFHFVKDFNELRLVRNNILRSHIESRTFSQERSSHSVVEEVVDALSNKDLNNPRIPHMLIGYFNDMEKVIGEWSRILARGARVAMVVDNVRFEGELIPVDLILSEMAEQAGFRVQKIIVCRYKGNSSQQMKKYGRVPVRESVVLWRKP
jgi:site-specific DNA-methyltransferase (cytosine-N4-specific)